MFKALLLDLDDTLIKSSQLYEKALHFASDYIADKYAMDKEMFFQVALEKDTLVRRNFPTVHTRHSRILVFRNALDEMEIKYDLSSLPDAEDIYWNYFRQNIEVYDGVLETLAVLKKHKIKTAIVSDGGLSLRIRKTQQAGLLPFIDEIFASEEVIFEKPFSAIFTLTLNRLGVEGNEAIMLGNNYKNDIRGAQLVGIRAGLFDPKKDGNVEGQDGTIVADFVIHEFSEILKEFGIKK
ncbi:MAG: HAD family hydrolase [Candidatus Dojkabacteria bacterium]|nr:MAG: HAD family hydrolase [Candidatus Dojkabacteria bacterium]